MTKKIHLLSIEDDLDDVYIIKQMLAMDARADYEFTHCKSLQQAEALIHSENFDALLLDLNLPDSDGLTSISTLAKQFPRLPIIVITDSDLAEFEDKAVNAGAEDFLTKSDLSNRLLSRVIRLSIERKQLKIKIEESALTDELTGLFTRQSFYQQLNSAIAQAERSELSLAVAFIDLDKFKVINDTYGHRIGDRVLQSFGQFLTNNKRKSDIACRLGGDEFALLIVDYTSEKDLTTLLERWLSQPPLFVAISGVEDKHEIAVDYSIGVKPWQAGMSADNLLEHADQAMYAHKREKQ